MPSLLQLHYTFGILLSLEHCAVPNGCCLTVQDVPKAGLMGFADVAPDAAKVLVVHFTHEKQAFMVTLEEQVDALLVEFYEGNILANTMIKSL